MSGGIRGGDKRGGEGGGGVGTWGDRAVVVVGEEAAAAEGRGEVRRDDGAQHRVLAQVAHLLPYYISRMINIYT